MGNNNSGPRSGPKKIETERLLNDLVPANALTTGPRSKPIQNFGTWLHVMHPVKFQAFHERLGGAA